MHVQRFLHKILGPVIHKSRVKVLSEVVLAAIHIKQLVLTKLGRGLISKIQERSGIQKVNRLLGNQYLHMERALIAKTVSNILIGTKKYPEIIVDWTKYSNSKDAILRASLSAEGRAITIYEERHPIKKMGNRKIQISFLRTLKNRILPVNCQPIIVTDAGFHNEWFKEVLNLGWDYVGRIRGLKKCRAENEAEFKSCKKLFKLATHKIKHLGKMILTKKNPLKSEIYIVKSKLKGRKALTKQGKIRKDKDSKNYSKAQREPWLLASSLSGRNAAKKVRLIYSRRMTIEEGIRDLKSSKYGFGLEEGKTRKAKRRDILLLIGMLASLIAWLTGKIGEKMELQYQFQSNSIKYKRVISLVYLGCQLIKKGYRFTLKAVWEVIASLKSEAIYI